MNAIKFKSRIQLSICWKEFVRNLKIFFSFFVSDILRYDSLYSNLSRRRKRVEKKKLNVEYVVFMQFVEFCTQSSTILKYSNEYFKVRLKKRVTFEMLDEYIDICIDIGIDLFIEHKSSL